MIFKTPEFEESEREQKDNFTDVAWVTFWMVLMIFTGFYALTKGHGLEKTDLFVKFTLFGVMIVAFVIFAIAITLVKFFNHDGFWKDVYIPLFDPEKGYFNITHGLKFFLYTMLVVSLLAFVSSLVPQSSLANFLFPLEVGGVPQQVTKGSVILFGFYNSPAENAFLYIILSGLVTLQFVLGRKYTSLQKSTIFMICLIPNIFIGSTAWLQIHDLVSADNSVKELSHRIFGAEMAAATLLTGTIIIPEILHATNNLFLTIHEQYGQAVLIVIFSIQFLILLSIIVYLETQKRK